MFTMLSKMVSCRTRTPSRARHGLAPVREKGSINESGHRSAGFGHDESRVRHHRREHSPHIRDRSQIRPKDRQSSRHQTPTGLDMKTVKYEGTGSPISSDSVSYFSAVEDRGGRRRPCPPPLV
mmetsp:Transcript_35785/g.78355  ORF Transcript_35785/g.78355 Transcript_35785/m.78355 type:complete len:123 (+) Transcript_35785:78-446(+)